MVLIGMIRCHLSRMMGERKLKVVDVVRETGLGRHIIRSLYKEKNVRLDMEVIEQLCRYFNCEVGDLFELEKDK